MGQNALGLQNTWEPYGSFDALPTNFMFDNVFDNPLMRQQPPTEPLLPSHPDYLFAPNSLDTHLLNGSSPTMGYADYISGSSSSPSASSSSPSPQIDDSAAKLSTNVYDMMDSFFNFDHIPHSSSNPSI